MKNGLGRFSVVSAAVVVSVALFAGSASAQTPGPGGMMDPGSSGGVGSGMGVGNMAGGSSSGHQFMMGFGTMASMMGDVAGQPVEDEWHGANGDGIQRTTIGMMVWRKADNGTAFTNGYMTWVNGPYGMQMRLNSDRFPWEAQ
jgi:hypothetical protein